MNYATEKTCCSHCQSRNFEKFYIVAITSTTVEQTFTFPKSRIEGYNRRKRYKSRTQSAIDRNWLQTRPNAKKKETAPDGSPDQNVFDIMQGVSINIFIKKAKK